MDPTKFSNLSIRTDRYNNILKTWKTAIQPTLPPELNFTQWVTATLESTVKKSTHLKKAYPDYHVIITSTGTFIIEHKDQLIKVFVKDGKIDCVGTTDKEPYIRFALMHPLFQF